MMNQVKSENGRDARGRMLPGHTSNPKGRNKINDRVRQLRDLLESEVDALIKKVIQAALNGDMTAAKLILDKCLPNLRPVTMPVELPSVAASDTPLDKARAAMELVTKGQLAPDVGIAISKSLIDIYRVEKFEEIEERLAKLES